MAKSRVKVVAILAAVLVALGAGTAAFILVSASSSAATAPALKEPEPVQPGPQYLLKERIINLADPGARRFIKVAMAIEMGGAKDEGLTKSTGEERHKKQAEFEASLAPWGALIDDAVLEAISSRTTADLASLEGKARLKDDIKVGVNRALGAELATNVFFTQFVMQ